jgi:hypothetical protein
MGSISQLGAKWFIFIHTSVHSIGNLLLAGGSTDSGVSHAATACLRGLLDIYPEVRTTAEAALESDWLRREARVEDVRPVLGAAAA